MSPRRSSIGFGGRNRPAFLVGVALATLLILGACTSTESTESTTTSSTDPVSTTGEPSSTSTSTSTPLTTTTTRPSEQNAIDAWSAYWHAWTEVRASQDLNRGPLDAVASSDVVDGALTLFERQRSSGLGPVQTEVVLSATVTAWDDDRATVEDCVLLVPSFTEAVGVWYQADLVRTGEGWIVDALRIFETDGCVPAVLAEAAIVGYRAYYEAEAEFWDPPDPENPQIEEVLAEPQKSFIVGLLQEHQSRGVALRGQPTVHPEVIEVRSPTEVVILSCSEPDPEYGLYDARKRRSAA